MSEVPFKNDANEKAPFSKKGNLVTKKRGKCPFFQQTETVSWGPDINEWRPKKVGSSRNCRRFSAN